MLALNDFLNKKKYMVLNSGVVQRDIFSNKYKLTMKKVSTEEKSPLLFVVDEDIPLKEGYFEGGRFNGIATGATTVFTHFPNYIGTCWIASAVSALVFFMLILLVLSTLTAVSLRVPRCIAAEEPSNRTVYLVHVPNLQDKEIENVEFIIQQVLSLYPTYNIRIIAINNKQAKNNNIARDNVDKKISKEYVNNKDEISSSTSTTTTTKRGRVLKRRREIEDAQMLLNMLLYGKFVANIETHTVAPLNITTVTTTPPAKSTNTIEELVEMYPRVVYENTTYSQALFGSPLDPHYRWMNEKLKIFAVRVLQLWQYGGISFDLQNPITDLKQLTSNQPGKSPNFVITEKDQNNNNLTDVVSVDDQALHLESKVPCHAFFGELLMILRKANEYTSVKDVMKKAIKSFCKHYAVNLEYCKMYKTA